MDGPAIEAVRRGLELFQREVAADVFANEVVKVGAIVFNHTVNLVGGGLVPIADFQPPTLSASGTTRLDLAFKVLLESMDRDVVKAVKGGHKGDWKPVVFILTDGQPTNEQGYASNDLWPAARDAVVNRPQGEIKPSTILAVGCGTDIDDATLKMMGDHSLHIDGSGASLVALFQYVTQSIVRSVQPGGNKSDPFANISAGLDIPDL